MREEKKVAKGFYDELSGLRKKLGEADFGFLRNILVDKKKKYYAYDFLHGRCDEFAVVLPSMYGYEIEAIRHSTRHNLIHAYCTCWLNGEKAYIDVRGITTDVKLFLAEFDDEISYYEGNGCIEDYDGESIIERCVDKDSFSDGDYENFESAEITKFIKYYKEYYFISKKDREKPAFYFLHPYQLGDLYHVGTMDISKKRTYSLEGNGLSVSNCPDAWKKITDGYTYGDTFELEDGNAMFLDFYSLKKNEKDIIKRWGLENGYVTKGKLYKYIFCGEDANECYSLFATREEALYEADNDEDAVKMVQGLIPTEKMLKHALTEIDYLQVFDELVMLYTEQVLHYDGIWWAEELDIPSYSAPRGVIFNSCVPFFHIHNHSQKNTICWHVTLKENVPSIREKGLLPMIGERSEMMLEENPRIYLFPTRGEMENALMNWMGEEFEDKYGENVELALLKVSIPWDMMNNICTDAPYEFVCMETIPAKYIEFFDESMNLI